MRNRKWASYTPLRTLLRTLPWLTLNLLTAAVLPEKTYQVEGVVDDIAAEYWVLQSEMGLFKFKFNPESQADLKKVKVGDRVSVDYRVEVIRVSVAKGSERNDQRSNKKNNLHQNMILDDRAFYGA